MAVIVDGNEIVLSGVVGAALLGKDDGFDNADVIQALARMGRDANVKVRLNSGGGLATEGAAIHSTFSAHKGVVSMVVEGVAASAASLIAMAGDTIEIRPGAVLMVHEPAAITFGTAADHLKTIEGLEVLTAAYAAIYADRTNRPVDEIRAVMREEVWMTGPAAVAAGFAETAGITNDNEPEVEPAAFAYGAYAKAPERLVALASARGWKARAMMAAPVAPTRPKETSMSDTPAGEAPTKTLIASNIPDETDPLPGAGEADPIVLAAPEAVVVALDASAIAEMAGVLAAAGMAADKVVAFINGGGTVEKAQARAADIATMRALAGKAGKDGAFTALADEFVANGKGLDAFRAALIDKIVDKQSPEIAPHVTADARSTGPNPLAAAVEARNARFAK